MQYVDRAFHRDPENKGKAFALRPSQIKLPYPHTPTAQQQILEVTPPSVLDARCRGGASVRD